MIIASNKLYASNRDWLIGNITHSPIPTQNLTNGTTYSGTTSWANYTYQSQITYLTGLLQNTNIGINHNSSVGVNGVNSTDGFVAVIEVKITGTPPTSYVFFFISDLSFFSHIYLDSHGELHHLIYGKFPHFSSSWLSVSYQLLFHSTQTQNTHMLQYRY